jgi:sodium-coupled neutral amino acid transporter 9
MYLLGLVTVFPCFMDVSRQRLFSAFSQRPISDLSRGIFNIGFMLVSFGFEILSPYIKLSDIMNFNGAVFCFFFVYLIPTALHLKCYYGNNSTDKSSMITTEESLLPGDEIVDGRCQHRLKDINYIPKWFRLSIYSILLLIGLATMIYGVYSSILIFM